MLDIHCLLLRKLDWTVKRCVNCRQLPFVYWAWKCTPPRNQRVSVSAECTNVTNVTRQSTAKRGSTLTYLTSCLRYCVYCLRNGQARSWYCCEYFFFNFMWGKMCYFMVNSWRLRFGSLSLRFWLKTNSFATLTCVFFSQTSIRVHQILTFTYNHEVTP